MRVGYSLADIPETKSSTIRCSKSSPNEINGPTGMLTSQPHENESGEAMLEVRSVQGALSCERQ